MSVGIILILSYQLILINSLPFALNFLKNVAPLSDFDNEDFISFGRNLTDLSALAGVY